MEETRFRPAISLSISIGAVFSLVGEVEVPVNCSIASLTIVSRCGSESCSCRVGSILGDNVWDKELACTTETLDVVGVFDGEDFVGEMDLARSELHMVSERFLKKDELSTSTLPSNCMDLPARRAFRSSRPCRISSSSFLFLSSSSWSRRSPNSLIRWRKSFTSSESAGEEDILTGDKGDVVTKYSSKQCTRRYNASQAQIHPPAGLW